jgi:transcriptional regulator with PAS, ATPase and Fis domain
MTFDMTHDMRAPNHTVDLESLVNTHDEPFVLIDRDYTVVAANLAYSRSYGVAADQIVGRKCHMVSHRSEVPCHHHGEQCPHREAFETGKATEAIHIHFDAVGKPERVRLKAYPLHAGGKVTLLGESINKVQGKVTGRVADGLVGDSPAARHLVAQLVDAASNGLPLLLTGETGAGKELAAQFVHSHSTFCGGEFVVVDCTAIPDALFESELYGHERGAFTGSSTAKQGLVEAADGGTLFLDELGELTPAAQAKLLRFIETLDFRRVGSTKVRRVNCRVIAATNRNLAEMVRVGGFRQDLFYRLAAVEVRVPSLRERRPDITLLAGAFLARFSMDRPELRLSPAAMERLSTHGFPGNVRELRNLIQRLALNTKGTMVDADAVERLLQGQVLAGPERSEAAGNQASELEEGLPLGVAIASLCACGLKRREIAQRLGLSERTVYRHLAKSQE